MSRYGTRLLALVLAVALPSQASASLFDTYGFGSRGAGMGNALTAASTDYLAAYYNPADLIARKRVHAGAGVVYLEPMVHIDRDKPDSVYESVLPGRNVGFTMGLSAPLGGVFDDKVALGLCLFVPLLSFTRAQFDDYRKPQVYLHDNLTDKLLIAAGGAVEALPWLRLGVGFQLLANLTGTADFDMTLLDGRLERESLSIDLNADLAVTAGIAITPFEGFELGVSYRQELDFQFALPVRANVAEFGLLKFDLAGTSLYTPHQINVGVSYRFPSRFPVTLATDVTIALWSLAPSPSPAVSFSVAGDKLLGANAPQRPIIDVVSASVPIQAKDIAIPRVGLEIELADVRVHAGYAYRPTPLPRPVAEASYIDSNTHVFAMGADWSLRSPSEPDRSLLTIGFAFQAAVLESRRVDKIMPDDPTGSFGFGGTVLHFGVDVQHDF